MHQSEKNYVGYKFVLINPDKSYNMPIFRNFRIPRNA